MAPVIKAVADRNLSYRFILTGQHRDTVSDIARNFGLRDPDYILYDGPDIVSIRKMCVWAVKILWRTYWDKDRIFSENKGQGIVLVHGDTFSTLLGALMSKIAGLKVGHVESGLRSFNLLHPFPEEITRLLVFHIANIYFCPGPWAVKNLKKFGGQKIDTHNNTLYDALNYALALRNPAALAIPNKPYGIVSLHRFENIRDRRSMTRVLEIVEHIATDHFLLFILHNPTEYKLRKFGLYDRISKANNIEMRSRYDYFSFVRLITNSEFVVTDGGSNQEECAYLGKPVLLLRKATERKEGIGHNCVLSNYDYRVIDKFLLDYPSMKRMPFLETTSPSDIIVESCRKLCALV